jgi:1,4-alpha-glucan branching enzyme
MVGIEGRLVRFEFLRPSAAEVRVVGNFPADVGSVTMQRRNSGHWTAAVELPPGTYRFRYEADGQWFNDYAAFGLDHGPFGLESVVRVQKGASSPTAVPGFLCRASASTCAAAACGVAAWPARAAYPGGFCLRTR